MDVTQAFTIGELSTFIAILATLFSFYRLGIRPMVKDAQDVASWRKGVDHRLDALDARINQAGADFNGIRARLESIDSKLGDFLARVLTVEAEHRVLN